MSDHIDNTDKIIFAEVPHGYCHYYDEVLAPALLFCDVDCRDDYEKEQAAKTRAGRAG